MLSYTQYFIVAQTLSERWMQPLGDRNGCTSNVTDHKSWIMIIRYYLGTIHLITLPVCCHVWSVQPSLVYLTFCKELSLADVVHLSLELWMLTHN